MGSAPACPPVSVIAEGEQYTPFSTRRCPGFERQTLQNPPEYPTMQPWALDALRAHAKSRYLGYRKRLGDNNYAMEYTWSTYEQAEETARDLGSGLWEAYGLGPQGMVGIYAENRIEWIHLCNASSLFGQTVVSLYDSFGDAVLGQLIEQSEITALLVSGRSVPRLLRIVEKNHFRLKYICMLSFNDGPLPEDTQARFEAVGLQYDTFEHICEIGSANRHDLPQLDPEWCHYVCYSSGTTGTPKGVLVSHRSMVNNSLDCVLCLNVDRTSVHLCYLPLPHVFERSSVSVLSYVGGSIALYSGHISRLTEDMKVLRPTHLTAVPRVLNRIYDTVMDTVNRGNRVKKTIFWGMWYWKRWWIKHGYSGSWIADKLVFDKIAEQSGGLINQWVIGGAAMDPWIHEFLQYATGKPVRAGYGMSELGSGNILNPFHMNGCRPGTVGGPMCNIELRLEPLEDYDDPLCGELLCGGQMLCSGYLNDPEQTQKLFLDESRTWIRSGDIAKWDPDNYLMVVDRMRSIFKLSQGEYVAAELLTNIYELAELVQQIFVYGDSSRNCLVAVVVPNRNMAAQWAKREQLSDEEFTELCQRDDFAAAIQQQLDELTTTRKLPGYERIRAITLEPVVWTIENNILTPTFKLRRKKLADKYKDTIEKLYRRADPPKLAK
jgi:long-chain acyl-CoA synthetase